MTAGAVFCEAVFRDGKKYGKYCPEKGKKRREVRKALFLFL